MIPLKQFLSVICSSSFRGRSRRGGQRPEHTRHADTGLAHRPGRHPHQLARPEGQRAPGTAPARPAGSSPGQPGGRNKGWARLQPLLRTRGSETPPAPGVTPSEGGRGSVRCGPGRLPKPPGPSGGDRGVGSGADRYRLRPSRSIPKVEAPKLRPPLLPPRCVTSSADWKSSMFPLEPLTPQPTPRHRPPLTTRQPLLAVRLRPRPPARSACGALGACAVLPAGSGSRVLHASRGLPTADSAPARS